MLIGGLEKLSLIDYPGNLAAIVFTKGCNFRCPPCHNPMLVLPQSGGKVENIQRGKKKGYSLVEEDGLFQFLKERVGKLEAVVITGGEPTIHDDLSVFIEKIKKLGYLIKLDTNGSNPEILSDLIKKNLLDYIAMDLKADEEGYETITGVKIDFDKISKSVKIIMESNLPYEFRTTCVPGFLDKKMVENMGKIIKGASKWYLQAFKSDTNLVDKDLINKKPFTHEEMETFAKTGKKYVKLCEIRE